MSAGEAWVSYIRANPGTINRKEFQMHTNYEPEQPEETTAQTVTPMSVSERVDAGSEELNEVENEAQEQNDRDVTQKSENKVNDPGGFEN